MRRSAYGTFADNYLKRINEEKIKQARVSVFSSESSAELRERVFSSAVDACHRQVSETGLDTSCSGSTMVSVVCMQDRLVVANVGDSRAVLCSLEPEGGEDAEQAGGGRVSWKTLSHDHKPNLPAEMERIVKANGRVESVRDTAGNGIGPLRVWLKSENTPGLAMSRSIGDGIAHSVGVIHEPEVTEHALQEHDVFIVLASDGVWEFLSNDDVVKIVYPCWKSSSPEIAAERVIKESLSKWKTMQDFVDDITVIVVFLKNSLNVEGKLTATAGVRSAGPFQCEEEEAQHLSGGR